MATPTSHPHHHAQKPSSSHLTPASASSPPAPPSAAHTNRSVASPVYSRTPASRSLHHRNGSAQIAPGSTPRGGPSTGTPRPGTTSATDSPAATAAAAMLMNDGGFAFPAGAGAGMGLGLTPRGIGLTPTAMQLSASQGGISGLGIPQDHEEERRRRMEAIVGMFANRWGFVSQEGVERCAKKLGFDGLWEDGMGIGDVRKRTLSIAGSSVLVDVVFSGDEVREVTAEGVGMEHLRGAEALKTCLKGDGEDLVRLESFAENLETLGKMDRLGGSGFSCFDAVSGLYKSLERVFAWEVAKVKGEQDKGIKEEVICRRNGRVSMHAGGRLGLSLQYWIDRARLVEGKTTAADMDIDDKDSLKNLPLWTAILECEASAAEAYPSARVSDAWTARAAGEQTSSVLDVMIISDTPFLWQEPPPTNLTSDSQEASSMNDPLQPPKPPNVRFVARFEPPVIVPLQTAIQIHESVGSPLTQESLLPTTYEALLFADVDAQNPLLSTPRTVEKNVMSYNPSTETSVFHRHKNSLFIQGEDFARAITHLPFSHPRQIIAILPILRQWALTASILRRDFIVNAEDANIPTRPETNGRSATKPQASEATTTNGFQTLEDELADFMASPLPSHRTSTSPTSADCKVIDITLATNAPTPRFTVHFPNLRPNGGKHASMAFSIGLNGVIEGVDFDDGGGGGENPSSMQVDGNSDAEKWRDGNGLNPREKIAKVVEIGESVGVLVEWINGGG